MRAKKRFGQHFLEPPWAAKLIAAIAPQPGETFIEIGPGRGALTVPLAARAHGVLAFEIDRDLAAELRAADIRTLTIVEGDFLQATADQIQHAIGAAAGRGSVRVAANLPYNVASPILFKLQELRASGIPIADATVMLQREVADRLTASPGTRDYGVLTVLIRQHATVERVFNLPPGAFRPVPKVRSSVVRLRYHPPDPVTRNQRRFEAFVQAVFTQRRKMLRSSMTAFAARAGRSAREALDGAGIDGSRRAEALTLQELARLADMFL
jgi:16S rRNA (adenine1518-N6/adenine1519-N6)-dimethyltransferase